MSSTSQEPAAPPSPQSSPGHVPLSQHHATSQASDPHHVNPTTSSSSGPNTQSPPAHYSVHSSSATASNRSRAAHDVPTPMAVCETTMLRNEHSVSDVPPSDLTVHPYSFGRVSLQAHDALLLAQAGHSAQGMHFSPAAAYHSLPPHTRTDEFRGKVCFWSFKYLGVSCFLCCILVDRK